MAGGGLCCYCKVAFWMVTGLFWLVAVLLSWSLSHVSYPRSMAATYVWYGGVTESSVMFQTHGHEEFLLFDRDPAAVLSTNNNNNGTVQPKVLFNSTARSFTITGLAPTTQYWYSYGDLTGHLTTFAVPGRRWNFTLATSGCAYTGSRSPVFDRILEDHHPVLFLHLGDLHYADISSDHLGDRHAALRQVLHSGPQAKLFRHTALTVMWDDHDYLGDDSGYVPNSTAREVALQSYAEFIPSYDYQVDNDDDDDNRTVPYQAFTIGTVRIVVSDLRSEATPTDMMSAAQWEWLYDELGRASQYDFLLWVSTKPWNGPVDIGDDSWAGLPDQRAALSDFLSQNTSNVLAVSADAHMLAFDDGSHTYFGTSDEDDPLQKPPSFPLLQAGPLDRLGSTKGGLFTEGCTTVRWERNHQYATIRYEYSDDEQPCLIVSGWSLSSSSSEPIFEKRLCGDNIYQRPGTHPGSCASAALSTPTLAILLVTLVLLLISIGLAVYGLGCYQSLGLVNFMVLGAIGTAALGIGVPLLRNIPQFHTWEVAILLLVQSIVTMMAVGALVWQRKTER